MAYLKQKQAQKVQESLEIKRQLQELINAGKYQEATELERKYSEMLGDQ